jgi:hypothetical protein
MGKNYYFVRLNETLPNGDYQHDIMWADEVEKMAQGGGVDDKIRFDVYGYEKIGDRVQSLDETIRVNSYEEAEKLANKFLKENNLELVELYRKHEFVGSIRKTGGFKYSSRYKKEMATGGGVDDKMFSVNPHSIGKAKYVIDYYDGKSTHKDGSPFIGIQTFSNKLKLQQAIKELKSEGYTEVNNVFNDISNKKSKKNYYVQYNVGKIKYLVNFHDGVKTHKDGSAFYDIGTFNNQKDLKEFISELTEKGYTLRQEKGGYAGWKHKSK